MTVYFSFHQFLHSQDTTGKEALKKSKTQIQLVYSMARFSLSFHSAKHSQ